MTGLEMVAIAGCLLATIMNIPGLLRGSFDSTIAVGVCIGIALIIFLNAIR